MTPYVCPKCGHGFSGPYVRCIGSDGNHEPTFPLYRPRRFQPIRQRITTREG